MVKLVVTFILLLACCSTSHPANGKSWGECLSDYHTASPLRKGHVRCLALASSICEVILSNIIRKKISEEVVGVLPLFDVRSNESAIRDVGRKVIRQCDG